jgi:hypothetical protein
MKIDKEIKYWIPISGIYLLIRDSKIPGKVQWYRSFYYVGFLWKPYQIIWILFTIFLVIR